MSNSFYHKDLTEAQWNRIKFVFEEPAKVGRPPSNPRTVFNAIMWILKSGARLGLFQRLFKLVNADANNSTLRLIRLIHDSEPAIKLFYNVEIAGKKILADKTYPCQAIRDYF